MQSTGVFSENFVLRCLIYSYQIKILTIKKKYFGVWPKQSHFNFFKEDYYV